MSQARIPDDLRKWIEAGKRHHLSHAHVQMARELGMNPKSLGKLDNHRQERWKLPLPLFIEELYLKRFGKERPDKVVTVEERALQLQRQKAVRREARQLRREMAANAAAEGGNDQNGPLAPPPAVTSGAAKDTENGGMNLEQDQAPPLPVAEYREMQRVIPAVEELYLLMRAALDSVLDDQARILIGGAGGGREIENLAQSPKRYSFIAVDPATSMLDQARACAAACDVQDRTLFIPGLVYDAPDQPLCDAATSMLVMHFLDDNGSKANYLAAIRRRVRPGGPLILADVSFDDRAVFERMSPIFMRHAELAGLDAEKAADVSRMLSTSRTIIGEKRTRTRLAQAGFRQVTPLFRGLWYAAWMAL